MGFQAGWYLVQYEICAFWNIILAYKAAIYLNISIEIYMNARIFVVLLYAHLHRI